jgi:putative redox protein
MVSTEFGQNPSVSLKKVARAFVSGSDAGSRGLTKGINLVFVVLLRFKKRKKMADTNHVSTRWVGGMAFESTNPSGLTLRIDASPEDGGQGSGLRPKALMLSALAGCSGLDVASIIQKMKLEVRDFNIDIDAELSESQPQTYTRLTLNFHFYGRNLDLKKLERAVALSLDKYCGVMAMFRNFAEMTSNVILHED